MRKALSGVARVHGRFGLQLAAKLVHGEADPRLERSGLARLQTFGNLREYPEAWLLTVARRKMIDTARRRRSLRLTIRPSSGAARRPVNVGRLC